MTNLKAADNQVPTTSVQSIYPSTHILWHCTRSQEQHDFTLHTLNVER